MACRFVCRHACQREPGRVSDRLIEIGMPAITNPVDFLIAILMNSIIAGDRSFIENAGVLESAGFYFCNLL